MLQKCIKEKRNFFGTKECNKNALKLYNKRTDIINAFVNGDILFGNLETDACLLEDLESEPNFEKSTAENLKMRRQKKSDKENQEGQGLKILTPDQILSGLPIALVQLKAGNDSEKLKNEIRQLVHSFYYSNKLTKTVYSNFINII